LPATLLDLVGAPPLPAPHARSLLPIVNGVRTSDVPPAYAETYLPQFYLNWAPLRSLRDERWKFIDAPKAELYDLVNDPGERKNLYDQQPRTAEAMRGALNRVTGGHVGVLAAGTLDRDAQERLAALGYIGAAAEAPQSDPAQRRDPKDMIALFNRLRAANSAVRDRRFGDALPILRAVLDEDPKNAFAQLVMGSAYMGMGDCARAIEQYRRYVELVPTSSYAHQWMAICYVRLNKQEEALREAEAALVLDPRSTDARVLRAGIFASRGQYDQSIAELRAGIANDPAKPMVRLDLAKVLDEAGRHDEARREYETIVGQQADYAPALMGLGAIEAQSGKLAEAEKLFRKVLVGDPSLDSARFNLARVLEQQKKTEEASAEYRSLVEDPRTSPQVRAAAKQRLSAVVRSP
jgi:choline-sulfatase